MALHEAHITGVSQMDGFKYRMVDLAAVVLLEMHTSVVNRLAAKSCLQKNPV